MPKNIVFCADGTWNGPGRDDLPLRPADPTNVFRLFAHLAGQDDAGTLALADEQERHARAADGTTAQVAKYLHGVGDALNPLVKLLGGAFGTGIITRIVRGYTFISRNYAAGDRIFIAGFSRGAYTARALAGLIGARGLLDASRLDLSDKERAYRLGAAVWTDWRREAGRGRTWLAGLEEAALDLPAFLSAAPTDKRIADVPIEAVAVWDTVGALGIPDYVGLSGRVDAFRFADVVLGRAVQHGFHAISIDERRADFCPTYWAPDPRIMQCLFPGAHADVGGGYPMTNNESGLSDCAYGWMRDNLAAVGALFAPACPIPLRPDPAGVAHQPWTEFPFDRAAQGPRELPPAGLMVSDAAHARLAAGPVQAAPELMPAPYRPVNLQSYLKANAP